MLTTKGATSLIDSSYLYQAVYPAVRGLPCRLSVRAVPFLLPLMLQVGFGMTPFESGSLTFASAVGALTMKIVASPILRRWGFRRVLSVNAVLSSVLLAASAAFTALTPPAVIIVVLLDLSRSFDGRTALLADDFGRAFIAIGLIALASTAYMLKLKPEAGAEVSGHRHEPAD